MSIIKLSIVIPLYNVEKYIEKCIYSIEHQDIPSDSYEVVVVNDGSTDRSVELVESLQKEFSNITVIHQENGGLSKARNTGLKQAKGEYVWFIDSDDYIDENILSQILAKAYQEDLDLLGFGHKEIYEETGKTEYPPIQIPPYPIDNIECLKNYTIHISAWSHIAKRKIMIENDIFFTEGIYHEDYDFSLRLYEHLKRINFLDIYAYNYILKEKGTITSSKELAHCIKRMESWLIIIRLLHSLYPDAASSPSYAYYAQRWINMFKYHALSTLLFLPIPYSTKYQYYRKLIEIKGFPAGETQKLTPKRKIVYFIYCHPFLYRTLLKAYSIKMKLTQ